MGGDPRQVALEAERVRDISIAIYERVQEFRLGTRRYFADVERLMPFAMAVIFILASLLFAGLYLDISQPIG